jgi:hypothetical protein
LGQCTSYLLRDRDASYVPVFRTPVKRMVIVTCVIVILNLGLLQRQLPFDFRSRTTR